MKARTAKEAKKLEDIPNIGKAMVRDFSALGIHTPRDLKKKHPYTLYKNMCAHSGVRQDPCVLDTYMAAIDFMQGKPARPWFFYTAQRKKEYPNL